jgi:hypothetical protein
VWVIAAVGLALPGLRVATARLMRSFDGARADVEAEVLTGFLTALRGGYEAELIARTRLERITLNGLAVAWKIPPSTLAADRAAAEQRLVAYLRGGSIPATAATVRPAPHHRRARHLA